MGAAMSAILAIRAESAQARGPEAFSADPVGDFLLARQQVKSSHRATVHHMSDSSKSLERVQQQRRLSAALRENLKRRKEQAKGRVAAERAGRSDEPHDSAEIVADKKS
jgi:hypothetical protein